MREKEGIKRVVITGLGAITPIGLTVDEFWANLTGGVSGVAPITLFDATDLPTRIAAEAKGFDPRDYMDFKVAKRSHRSAQFALTAAHMALADAGLTVDRANADQVGVVMNTGGGGIGEMEAAAHILAQKGPGRVSPFVVPKVMANAVACLISIHIGARGPVMTSTAACASGNYAFVEGLHLLQRGEAEAVIAGGTEAAITPVAMASLGNAGALSRRNDEPQRASRPFDQDRDGFVMGEGAVVMILETERHALARGAHIYAEVAGGSLTADAYHVTAPDPDGDGAIRAMRLALEWAQMQPQDMDAVFAHGTSTPLNDMVETKAIKAVFGEHAYRVPISATKSMVGHALGAAGALSALAAVLTIRDGLVPPTINLETPDPECDLDYVPGVACHQPVQAAMVNAFGFGGQNAVLIVKEYVA